MATYQSGTSPEEVRAAVALALSPERRRLVVTAAAREAQARAEAVYRAQYGRVPETEILVDGRAASGLDGLNADRGEVIFRDRVARANEALAWIYAQIVAHSPVLTGRYASEHVLLADGAKADPSNPPPADRYVFMNLAPYARKIERGQSPRAPGGVYQAVAVLAACRVRLRVPRARLHRG